MSENATTRILREARAKIQDPADWVRGSWYGASRGYCAAGAVAAAVTGNPAPYSLHWQSDDARPARELLESVVGSCVYAFNDRSTHNEVLAAFDRAIELAVSA